MRVLIGCEFSGVVREAFRRRNLDAWSCDLLPAEDASPFHIQDDLLHVIGQDWHLAIFHPPCTYLTNAASRYLSQPGRREAMRDAAKFFRALWKAPIPHICIENPIPNGEALRLIGRPYTQLLHPWQFGHGESKPTCLWLKNLPLLRTTKIVSGRDKRLSRLSPSPDRWKERSRFYPGFAEAMAMQWGRL